MSGFSRHNQSQLITRPDVSPEIFEAYRCCALKTPFSSSIPDSEHFLHCCRRHGLTVALYENLEQQENKDKEVFSSLSKAYRHRFLAYAQYLTVLTTLDKAMASENIKVVLLKGASLWFSCYREQPMSRDVSDLDILVRQEDRETLTGILNRHGFMGTAASKTFRDRQGRIIDLHSRTLGIAEEFSGITTEAIWASSSPLKDFHSLRLMDPSLETHYLALHALRHSFLRFTWLRDVTLSSQRTEVQTSNRGTSLKAINWCLYLNDVLTIENPPPHGLNALERYLGRRMLCEYKHPLGKFLVAIYQPSLSAKIRCLLELIQREGDRNETLPARLVRLLRNLIPMNLKK